MAGLVAPAASQGITWSRDRLERAGFTGGGGGAGCRCPGRAIGSDSGCTASPSTTGGGYCPSLEGTRCK